MYGMLLLRVAVGFMLNLGGSVKLPPRALTPLVVVWYYPTVGCLCWNADSIFWGLPVAEGLLPLKPVAFLSVFLRDCYILYRVPVDCKSSSLSGVNFANDDEEICWWIVAISLGYAVNLGSAGMDFGLVCWHIALRFPSLSSTRFGLPPPFDVVDNANWVLYPFLKAPVRILG
ncbi:hypothetical protein Nepgr_013451 [Nepenthes gracilis]|uniref:Uncharacterized protein n=1 Tax=Nepenthes gracilis TaxID=150966 RepID=A0AAD3XPE7_NEPGR|nr:hypothetical protein Nepgr_013451 [Nepenthes gracilis]